MMLHAQTLCAMFLGEGRSKEIKLETILSEYLPSDEAREAIQKTVSRLADAYGGERDQDSPWPLIAGRFCQCP
jgi:hypothetical protein